MSHLKRRNRRLWLPGVLATAICAVGVLVAASAGSGAAKATPIKVGFISTCKGPFAPFYDATLLGAAIAMIDSGGKPAGSKPSQGVKNLTIAGHPIQQTFGCSDATPDVALAEARRLVEQVGVDILIAPLSGSEGIAIARYSKTQPGKTFLNGTSGAQDTTLKVRSPNFYRFHTDGAQWMAGIGDYAYNTLKLHKVVTIGDDYDFPYTQTAGFVTEFCAIGGQIVKRIWPPLGTKDYSSYLAQIPKSGIDGFYLTVGGTGTVALVKEYLQETKGNLSRKVIFGSVALDPIVVAQLGARVVGGVTGTDTAADSKNPLTKKYLAEATKYYPALGAGAASSLFASDYWNNTWPVMLALKNIKGDLSGGQAKLHAELNRLGKAGLNTPQGFVKLDQNRNAIGNNYLIQLTSLKGGGTYKTIRTIPNVSQSFDGAFTTKTPTPSRSSPACAKRKPPSWVGHYQSGPPKK
jgi:branched-chain amino acid transport system substrate-binding protein